MFEQSEVNILGRRYHPNLIELLGYSWEDEKLVLVYEFMQKGSLENQLFQSDVFKPLSWDIRLRIAIGAARGLVFLHSLEKQIIYRDFKSSAILLDANYNPKLSDFGLAKLGPSGDKTHVTTRMMGTDGYVAPEYFDSGHLSVKSDVYSFGIVLFELLSGLRAADIRRTNDNFVKLLELWTMDSQLKTLMDVRMKGQYSLAQLTQKCLEVNHRGRPSMKDVLEELVQIEAMASMKEFNFEDLKTATNNFKPEAWLGEGGYGRVYKGWIDEKTLSPSEWGTGMAVVIKLWNDTSIQAFEQWQLELNILGRRYHPNLVKLLGYCLEERMLVLVYEFMQKGSLTNLLFQRNAITTLSWDIRLKIAIGAARGLLILHTLEKQIIYRDFKSSVILLDANYNPKLSDFGLAKSGPSGDKTHVTTRMMGTDGYVAPEYFDSGHLNAKSGAYSFGIVLLELLTGLRAVDLRRTNDNFVKWLKPMLSQPETLMDVRMKGQYSLGAACNAIQLTLKCLEVNHKNRPSMKEVLEVLVQIEAMTSMEEDPEVLEQIEAETSMKEVPEVLEQIEAVTSMTEVPEVLEHNEAIEEKPKNSSYRSQQSTAARCGQRSILHRFLTSLKEPFQCVSSKLNCI